MIQLGQQNLIQESVVIDTTDQYEEFIAELNTKVSLYGTETITGIKTFQQNLVCNKLVFSDETEQNTAYDSVTASYLSTLTSNVQDQLNTLAQKANAVFTGNVNITNSSSLNTNGDIVISNNKSLSTPYLYLTTSPVINYVLTCTNATSGKAEWKNPDTLVNLSSTYVTTNSTQTITGTKNFQDSCIFLNGITSSSNINNTGILTTTNLRVATNAAVGKFLKCTNVNGTAEWADLPSITLQSGISYLVTDYIGNGLTNVMSITLSLGLYLIQADYTVYLPNNNSALHYYFLSINENSATIDFSCCSGGDHVAKGTNNSGSKLALETNKLVEITSAKTFYVVAWINKTETIRVESYKLTAVKLG